MFLEAVTSRCAHLQQVAYHFEDARSHVLVHSSTAIRGILFIDMFVFVFSPVGAPCPEFIWPTRTWNGINLLQSTHRHSGNSNLKVHRVLRPGERIALFEYDHELPAESPEDMAESMRKINKYAAMPTNSPSHPGFFKQMLADAGFTDIVVRDYSDNIRPMTRLFFVLGIVPYLVVRLFGLKRHFINTVAGVEAYRGHGRWRHRQPSPKTATPRDCHVEGTGETAPTRSPGAGLCNAEWTALQGRSSGQSGHRQLGQTVFCPTLDQPVIVIPRTMPPASLSALPVELLVFIIEDLDRLKDIAALARIDRRLYDTANPFLYKRAAERGDAWPLAWAAQCGVVKTLRLALAVGLDPNLQLVDQLPSNEWQKATVTAKNAALGNGDDCVWESDNECDSNAVVEWSLDADGSDHATTLDTNQPSSSIGASDHWGHAEDSETDSESDVLMDDIMSSDTDDSSSSFDGHYGGAGLGPRVPTRGPGTVTRRFHPIHLAVRGGHKEIVEILLDHGVSVIACSENFCGCAHLYGVLNALESPENSHVPHWSPLHIAICHSWSEIAQLLLSRGAAPAMDLWNPHGEHRGLEDAATALHHAAAMGLTDVVRYLVDNKIQTNVDVKDNKTLTPLYHAYANGRFDSTLPLLLQLGANINVETKMYIPYTTITPLGEACRLGAFPDVDKMADLGADVNHGFTLTTNGGGLSPLHMCSMPSARPAGQSPLDICEDERAIPRMKTIEHLVSKGAIVDAKDCYGDTPLMAAAQHCNVPAIRALIKAGANINAKNAMGRTALMQAVVGPSNKAMVPAKVNHNALAQTMRALLNAGARIDETDLDGSSMLHLPFRRQKSYDELQLFMLRFFLNLPEIEKLFTITDNRGWTPFVNAFMTPNIAACDIFVRKGCLRYGLLPDILKDLFRYAVKDAPLASMDSLLEIVLDLDTDRLLTSDPSLFMTMFNQANQRALQALETIARRGVPSFTPADSTRLLCYALRNMKLSVAYSLIDAGANVNTPDESGEYPLALFVKNAIMQSPALAMPSAEQLLLAFIHHDANFHLPIRPGSSERILSRVIALEAEEALTLILKSRPLANDPRAANGFYLHSALSITAAQRLSNEKVIDIILSAGPDLTEVNRAGDTPLSVLLKSLCRERRWTWKYHRFIRALVSPDLDINRHNNDGKSIVDYLEDLMHPKNGGAGQTTFLTRRLRLFDMEGGGKSLKFLPRPQKRVRPRNIAGS
ncbi:ankyrin repeat-containing domain protein [Triangularia verruculosa]|uniref:Ankyrin repeat-containing domain protein n=1 Tax=Triangularia verruculosa TaxID=2587418 RepID=A0AAN6X6I6_9PEZI|nr:ankyrin repeat-containing domain protein [Triangularia verruculosa]